MLDPDKGRARIRREGETLIVEIPAKRQAFVIGFLGFWLCGWAFGWIAAAGALFSGSAGAGTPFVLFWLGAWTVGGVFAIAAFLWTVTGRETVRFSTSTVDIVREIPVWRKVTSCRFDALRNLRLDPTREHNAENQSSFWLSKQDGMIKISYGVHTLGFGLDLDEAEASRIIDTIGAIFPELAN